MSRGDNAVRRAHEAREHGDDAAARTILEAAARENPDDLLVVEALGSLLCDLGELDQATQSYRKLLIAHADGDPHKRAELLQALGDISRGIGKIDKANQLYQHAGKLDPARGQPARVLQRRVEEPTYDDVPDSDEEELFRSSPRLPRGASVKVAALLVGLKVVGAVLIAWGAAAIAEWNAALERLDGAVTAELTNHMTQSDDKLIQYRFQLEPDGPVYSNDDPANPFGGEWVFVEFSAYDAIVESGQVEVHYDPADPRSNRPAVSGSGAPGWVGVTIGGLALLWGFVGWLFVGPRRRSSQPS